MPSTERAVVYLAHPVAGDVIANLNAARLWLRSLMRCEQSMTFVAPWITAIDAGADEGDPAQRERGIADSIAVAARCDGIVLCGGRVTSGMRRELEACVANGRWVADLTHLGLDAPELDAGIVARFTRRPAIPRPPAAPTITFEHLNLAATAEDRHDALYHHGAWLASELAGLADERPHEANRLIDAVVELLSAARNPDRAKGPTS